MTHGEYSVVTATWTNNTPLCPHSKAKFRKVRKVSRENFNPQAKVLRENLLVKFY